MTAIAKQLFSPKFDVNSTVQSVELLMTKQKTKLYLSILLSAFAISVGVSA